MFYAHVHYTHLTIPGSGGAKRNNFPFIRFSIFTKFSLVRNANLINVSRNDDKDELAIKCTTKETHGQNSLAAVDADQVVSGEHSLGAAQNRIFRRIVRMILRRDLKNRWDWRCVRVDDVTNEFSVVLVDQDDVDVVAFQESLEAIFNFADRSV